MRISLALLTVVLTIPLVAMAGGTAETSSPVFGASAADTVHTNLWVAQALLNDIARQAADAIPVAGVRVSLRPLDKHEAAPLLEASLHEILTTAGHEVYLDESDTTDEDPVAPEAVDYEISYRFESFRLSYPEMGRRLGLWSTWVDREMEISVLARVVELGTGRLLLDQRLKREFGDRLASKYMDSVDEPTYAFTTAKTAEGGIGAVLEEVVVVGALAGLVAIYFANTGN